MQRFWRDLGVSHIVLEPDQKHEEVSCINTHNVQVGLRVNGTFLDDVLAKLSREEELTEKTPSLSFRR